MSQRIDPAEAAPVKALNYEIDTLIEVTSGFLNLLEYFKASVQQPGAITPTPPVALPSLPSISERVRFIRMVKGLSQDELAERVGVSRATINYVENGKSHPHELTSSALASVLGCNHFWLVTGLGDPHPALPSNRRHS